jgi:hypothetical protein
MLCHCSFNLVCEHAKDDDSFAQISVSLYLRDIVSRHYRGALFAGSELLDEEVAKESLHETKTQLWGWDQPGLGPRSPEAFCASL